MKKLICILIVFSFFSCDFNSKSYESNKKQIDLTSLFFWGILGGGLGISCSNFSNQQPLQLNQKVNTPSPSSSGPSIYKLSGVNKGNKIIIRNLSPSNESTCVVSVSFTLCNFLNYVDRSNLRENICSEFPNAYLIGAGIGNQTTCTINIDTITFQNSLLIDFGSNSNSKCSGQLEVN
jgi:hypothetical protein